MLNIKTYIKFLSRNKLYTFVSVAGFSVSLMFVILLGVYVKQELSLDSFQENKDRIYTMKHNDGITFGNTIADLVKDKCPEVESYTRIVQRTVELGGKNEDKQMIEALFADSAFFNIFSYKLIEGNPSQVLALQKTVVISQSFANSHYEQGKALGKIITIDKVEHTITGIMEDLPKNTILRKSDIIANYNSITSYWGDGALAYDFNAGFNMFFLAKKGADLPSKAPMMLSELKENFWLYKNGFTDGLEFVKLQDVYFLPDNGGYAGLKSNSKTQIYIYSAIALLILIVATLNYINMTVAQSGFRGKESATRRLLGCDRSTVILQILMESLLMTLCTFVLGLLMAFAVEPYFNDYLSTELHLEQQLTVATCSMAVVFVLLLSVIAGLIPAYTISSFSPIEIVKGTLNRKIKTSYSKVLIVFQYTVSIALLICSFMISEQSEFLVNFNTGFNKERIYQIQNGIDAEKVEGMRSKLKTISGVEAVSFSCGTPLDGGNNLSFEKDGESLSFQIFLVDDEFLDIYGITVKPIGIGNVDDGVWLNQKGYYKLGVDSTNFTADFSGDRILVSGIVSNFNFRTLHQEIGTMMMKKIKKEERPWAISVKIATNADLQTTVASIDKTYSEYNEGTLVRSQFVDQEIQHWYEKEKKTANIMTAFTLLTIIITIMGVFAMSLYLVRQKEKEIGIRKVNGATEIQVLVMLNADALTRVLIGFIIATPIAYYAITKWLESFAYKISINPLIFILAGIGVALVTIVSMSYMTWKAAKANPVETLKGE